MPFFGVGYLQLALLMGAGAAMLGECFRKATKEPARRIQDGFG